MSANSKEQAFATALRELESGIRHDGLWGMSFAEAMGDEQKAKAFYLTKRADELMRENSTRVLKDEQTVPRTQGILSTERGSIDYEKFRSDLLLSIEEGEISPSDATLMSYDNDERNLELFGSLISEQEVRLMERELCWFVSNTVSSFATSTAYFRIYNPTDQPLNEVLLQYRATKHSNYFFCNLGEALLPKKFCIRRVKLPFNDLLRHGYQRNVMIDVRGAR
jgi:hypothetical protein